MHCTDYKKFIDSRSSDTYGVVRITFLLSVYMDAGYIAGEAFRINKAAIYHDLHIILHSFFRPGVKQQCTIYHKKRFISGSVSSVYYNGTVFNNGVRSLRNLECTGCINFTE